MSWSKTQDSWEYHPRRKHAADPPLEAHEASCQIRQRHAGLLPAASVQRFNVSRCSISGAGTCCSGGRSCSGGRTSFFSKRLTNACKTVATGRNIGPALQLLATFRLSKQRGSHGTVQPETTSRNKLKRKFSHAHTTSRIAGGGKP